MRKKFVHLDTLCDTSRPVNTLQVASVDKHSPSEIKVPTHLANPNPNIGGVIKTPKFFI